MSEGRRILGLDPGTKRLGVALSDDMQWHARPLEVWKLERGPGDIEHIRALIEEHDVGEVVIGVPYRLDGSVSASTERALEFVARVRVGVDVPVTERDEALTTWEAEETLKAKGLLPKDRRGLVDAYAAAVMLQEVLDERGGAAG